MFRRYSLLLFFVALTGLNPEMAFAQDELSSCKSSYGDASRTERLEDNTRFYGTAEYPARIICDDMQFFADYAETFKTKDMVTAQGHVVYVSGGNRIAADRMEFNTKTRTGTFYNARGTAILGDRGESTDRSMFGGKEPDAYFWGESLTKLGPKKFKIENGGFTTCVQPTPRWEVVSGSVTINLDDYAFLTNSIFRVKGVPLMYLPIFYYPIQEDDRATGFLIPTYGASTLKGQMLSNAFFWAIGRSHDATIYHDWMSKAGNQLGGEYRYVLGPGSQGNSRFSFLDEESVTSNVGGVEQTTPGTRSYTISGDMMQRLPGSFSLRANADYFSSIVSQQTYQQDIARATNRNRRFGSYVTGAVGSYQISATADRTDYFYTASSLTTYGSMPRITISKPERPIAGSPVYLGVSSEYVTLLRSSTVDDVKTQDQGLTRFDVAPTVRVPFNRWPFLGINSAVTWRATYWTERLQTQAPVPLAPGGQVDEGVARQYFDFSVRATGPVFNRIFNPPEGKEGTKYKHVIQPSVTLQKVTNIDVFDQIVKLEGGDYTVGRTQVTYDLTNRLYAKKAVAREILSLSVNQSYYTDARAAQYDQQYQSSFTAKRASNFSPVAVTFRASPSDRLGGDFRTEWDPTAHALRSIAANANFSSGEWLFGSAGWSQRRYIPGLPGFDDPNFSDQYINSTVNVRGQRNRFGGNYSFNYDVKNDRFLNQRWVLYFNSQCCGVAIEYQSFNLQGSFVQTNVSHDRRFNVSFTLAGIGTFSNLFGAFGGQQSR
jgi:LPS-assembly protein